MILSTNITSILPNITEIPLNITAEISDDDYVRLYSLRSVGFIVAFFAIIAVLNCIFKCFLKLYNAGFYVSAVTVFLLPKKVFRSATDGEGSICVLCASNYKEGDSLRILPCEHVFHFKCLCRYAIQNARSGNARCERCPICLQRISRNFVTNTSNPFGLLPNSRSPLMNSEDSEWPSYGSALID